MIKKTKAKIRQQAAAQNPPKAYGINGKASHLLCHSAFHCADFIPFPFGLSLLPPVACR
jgi:hypothetical protein